MKVIGNFIPDQKNIDPKDEQGYLESDRYKYGGGSVVLLSKREMGLLLLLQNAAKGLRSDGLNFDPDWRNINNDAMDDLFMLVHKFTEVKFAINDFKSVIEELENILGVKKNDL